MSSLTPNYQFILPSVNDPTDQDLWGGYLNSNLSAQDTLIKSISDQANLASPATNAQTGNYSVLAGDKNKIILVDATGGNITVTLLPAATAGDGFMVSVKKIDSTTNTVTVDGNGAETIDGVASISYTGQWDTQTYICNGSTWFIRDDYGTSSTVGSGCSVYQSTGNTLPQFVETALTFTQEEYDELNCHDNTTNPSRFTFDFTGRIDVIASCNFGTPANSDYPIRIRKNGTTVIGYNNWIFKGSAGAANSKLTFVDRYDVVPGDYIEVLVTQSGAVNPVTVTGISETTVKILRVK